MSKVNRQSLPLQVIGMLVVLLVFVVGCSQSPTSSLDNPGQPQLLSRVAPAGSPQLSPGNLFAQATVSARNGGTLSLLDVTLEIPAGAIDNDTLFSIDIPDVNVFYNEFGTHGLVFNVPVKVTMSYRDADLSNVNEETIRIGWLNAQTGSFQDVECTVDHDAKVVTGYLEHFSAYALISD